MIELSDWLWLVVAVVWLALRVLPRLLSRKARPGLAKEARHERHEQLDAAEGEGRGGSGPPPIEPR